MRCAPRTRRPVLLAVTVCLGVLLTLSFHQTSFAQAPPAPPPKRDAAELQRREALRDSLRQEIQRYAEIIGALRDSVDVSDDGGLQDERLVEVEDAISSLSEAVGGVAEQLSELQLEVDGDRVSLRDGRGGQVTLDLPEDIGDRLSDGLSSITRVILDEMPDTIRVGDDDSGFTWNWSDDGLDIVPVAPPRPERVIEGGIVKLSDDLEVEADEVVLGDVVAVMGDALIAGRIEGDLIVVLGDLTLAESAEVEGEIVSILGRFDRADGARVGSVTVVNPGDAMIPGPLGIEGGGWVGFWGWQAVFMLLMFLVLLLLALTPRGRLDRVVATQAERGGESFGLGLLMALVGHFVLIGLAAILVLTVIGIPVAILVVVAVGLLDLAAVGIASLGVGRRICGALDLGCDNPWRAVVLGMFVLHAPAFLAGLMGAAGLPLIPVMLVSWIGRLTKLVAFCFGLGAIVLSRFGAERSVPASTVHVEQAPGSPVA